MLLFQHWIVVLLGIPVVPLTYIDLIKADKDAIEKFGDDYKAYMDRAFSVCVRTKVLTHTTRKNRSQSDN
jgi:protein-S-isoprenylcysteine O-methyltransferase Ste14